MTAELAHPLALVLLAVPALLAAWFAWRRHRQRPALRLPTVAPLLAAPRGVRARSHWLVHAGRLAALALVVVALARPRVGETLETVTTEGVDIVVALDVSGSMLAEDMVSREGRRQGRLDAAKEVAADFVAGRTADRIGLLTFDEATVPRCPPTLDHGVLLDFLGEVAIDDEGGRTAIGMAVASAVGRLRDSEARSRVVLLVTDGRNNAGRIEPADAAEMARLLGVKVHAIGIGSRGPAPYPVRSAFGRVTYRQVQSDIDEETLGQVAELTGGEYFRATDRAELQRVFERIDQMEKTEIEVEHHVRHDEHFPSYVRAAAALFALTALLGATLWRTFP
jgi:Ca-activated chloride channel family protein